MQIKKIIPALLLVNVLLFLAASFVYAQTAEDKRGMHGFIKYKLINADNNVVMSSGEMGIKETFVEKKDIACKPGKVYFEGRYFKIYDGFIVGFSNYGCKDKAALDGFGMWLNRLPHDVGSWEWYDKTDENTFKKLQGNGVVKVEYREREGYWEIAKIKFIGDQVFRCEKTDPFNVIKNIFFKHNEDWRCIISDGSYIEW
jgi:hypothetical protein